MADQKRVAVVGAGCTGILAIKSCLDEGLLPVCFERTDAIGGLWHYTDDVRDGQACVMKSTVINTSKEMTSFSDFPVPAEFPNFMHNKHVLRYFHKYCEKHDLLKYIQFDTEVIHIGKSKDFATNGRWEVKIKKSGKQEDLTFDAVLICTGHHAHPNMPTVPGQELFRGKVMHSHEYRKPQAFEDKTVVIVGIGNSAGDLAVDIAKITEQTYISTRRGAWVVHRIWANGYPSDMILSTRFNNTIMSLLSPDTVSNMVEKDLQKWFRHEDYGLRPNHRFTAQHGMVNDDLPNRIAAGNIIIKPDIKAFTANGVEFVDGTTIENVHVVIFATGYVFGFPFLDKSVIDVIDNKADLFKYTFPVSLEQPTLAVIGFVQPSGSTMTIAELQCRWATRVFQGSAKLPSQAEMMKDVKAKREMMEKRFYQSTRHTIQVDWLPFMDEIAEQVGCKPRLGYMLFKDPALVFKCFFGPCTPYQYRLEGPGKWSGARETIMTQWDRCIPVNKDGSKRLSQMKDQKSNIFIWTLGIALMPVAYFVYKMYH